MAIFLSVTILGVLGILQVVYVLALGARRLYRDRAEKLKVAAEEREAALYRPGSAWHKALTQEQLPRCEYCRNAGLGDVAIGHTVYDEDGQVACPILKERRAKFEDKSTDEAQILGKGHSAYTERDVAARKAAFLENVQEVTAFYDPYDEDEVVTVQP